MKKFFLSLVILTFLCLPGLSLAEGTSIAVVDMRLLLGESKAAEDIQKQVAKLREKFQNEYTAVEKRLRDKQKKLSEERSKLSNEEFAKKREEFEAQFIEARAMLQKSKRGLDEAVNDAMAELQGSILKIVAKIADNDGHQIVLSRQNVVIASNDSDITGAVMDELNDTVKKIKVTIDKE